MNAPVIENAEEERHSREWSDDMKDNLKCEAVKQTTIWNMRRWYERQFKIWSSDKKDNSKWRKLEMNASWKEDANSIVKWAPIAFCVYKSIVKAQHLSNKNWAIFVFEKSISSQASSD